MSKFKFEWKILDKYKYKGGALEDKKYTMNFLIPKERWNLIKPAGKKTKARYKAEKLAWQQSNIKAGDWVVHKDLKGKPYRVYAIRNDVWCDGATDGDGWHRNQLKPCKPPKPKELVIETETYLVKGVQVLSKDTGRLIAEHAYDDLTEATKMVSTFWRSGDQFRELADICDQLDALKGST